MRVFLIQGGNVVESAALPAALPGAGMLWIACARSELEAHLGEMQAALVDLTGVQLVELHVRDLLNPQLPSYCDYTSQYDVLVFRRLAASAVGRKGGLRTRETASPSAVERSAVPPAPASAPVGSLLRQIDTTPVGFAVFDRVLLSVHPDDCAVRDAFAARLMSNSIGHASLTAGEARVPNARHAAGPPDLMLRIVNLMVDGFLDLRRDLTQRLDRWQAELLDPKARQHNWGTMLDVRLALHELDQICEDQRAAIQDWIDVLESWPAADTPAGRRERELVRVRSRDVLEHIERVVHHVRRLEQSAETTVQMHFSAQSNRTNDIMRVLTVLTAVFLPLNLIAGIFGMNFEFIPLLHKADGFWIAMGAMGLTAVALLAYFRRKRYLERTGGG